MILPDIAPCEWCLKELFDQKNRRYMCPFMNCTHCGPRFTIIEKLPYDRPNTVQCKKEYENPEDRRFHAQPIACPLCGPNLSLITRDGKVLAEGDKSLRIVLQALRDGKIVAVKGIGGFHLMCNALEEEVVKTLRERKKEEEGKTLCGYV